MISARPLSPSAELVARDPWPARSSAARPSPACSRGSSGSRPSAPAARRALSRPIWWISSGVMRGRGRGLERPGVIVIAARAAPTCRHPSSRAARWACSSASWRARAGATFCVAIACARACPIAGDVLGPPLDQISTSPPPLARAVEALAHLRDRLVEQEGGRDRRPARGRRVIRPSLAVELGRDSCRAARDRPRHRRHCRS